MRFRRSIRTLLAMTAATLVAATAVVALDTGEARPAAAVGVVTGSDFDPGFIISDGEFFDGSAMTEAQIQSFLVAKVGYCANSYCLPNYRMNTATRAGDAYCSAYAGATNESAARVIAKVQSACNVSAKAILVTLQKEQGLVTSHAPSAGAIRSAMGYGCPDTAACDSQYYGFFNQVYQAARQFQRYANSGSFTWYPIGTPVAVRYHPNAACGAKVVTIRNKATAGLYYYTPYTPNAAALANLGGTGDACSSYGNRNFWYFYNTWFPSYDRVGRELMDAAYQSFGGSDGALGTAVGELNSFSANGGGMVQGYAHGAITWSRSSGKAFALLDGPLREAHRAAGGIAGSKLGWLASNQSTVTENGGGLVQGFQYAALTWTEEYGARIVSGGIRAAFGAAGGLAGAPGFPTGDATTSGGVTTQTFQGGKVYWSSARGGAFITKELVDIYDAAGGPAGSLGMPTGSATRTDDHGGGIIQGFAGGALVWSETHGAHVVSGGIRTSLAAAGGIAMLGWPTSDASEADGATLQAFEEGTVLWSSSAGGSFTIDAIEALATAAGANIGPPTGATSRTSAAGTHGAVRGYAGGAITWTPTTGAHIVSGGIRTVLGQSGGLPATGWPTADATTSGGVTTQEFQNGTITWHSAHDGAYLVKELAPAYFAAGGITGSLGAPTGKAGSTTLAGGGIIQGFAGGALTWNANAGAHLVTGGVRTTLSSAGGIGATGWPTADATTSGGVTTQEFQNGTITWHSAHGGAYLVKELAPAYFAAGGITGSLGAPTGKAGSTTLAGGGIIQGFAGGALTWNANAGAHLVTGGVRTTLSSAGGIGATGWPTADATTSGGVTTQEFQNGTITWSAAEGGSYTPR